MSEISATRAPSEEHVTLLRARAADLARVSRAERDKTTTASVLFLLGGETYALAASVVHQVIVLRDLTPLPGARAPLFGLTHWRGDVLTILDLRADLGVRPRGVTDLSRVIVVDGGVSPFGILVDAARDFVDIAETAIRPLPSEEMSQRRLVRGMTDDAVLVIDVEALLQSFGNRRSTDVSTG